MSISMMIIAIVSFVGGVFGLFLGIRGLRTRRVWFARSRPHNMVVFGGFALLQLSNLWPLATDPHVRPDQNLFVYLMICIVSAVAIVVTWRSRGYVAYGSSPTAFREAVFTTLRNQNIPFEGNGILLRLPSEHKVLKIRFELLSDSVYIRFAGASDPQQFRRARRCM